MFSGSFSEVSRWSVNTVFIARTLLRHGRFTIRGLEKEKRLRSIGNDRNAPKRGRLVSDRWRCKCSIYQNRNYSHYPVICTPTLWTFVTDLTQQSQRFTYDVHRIYSRMYNCNGWFRRNVSLRTATVDKPIIWMKWPICRSHRRTDNAYLTIDAIVQTRHTIFTRWGLFPRIRAQRASCDANRYGLILLQLSFHHKLFIYKIKTWSNKIHLTWWNKVLSATPMTRYGNSIAKTVQ